MGKCYSRVRGESLGVLRLLTEPPRLPPSALRAFATHAFTIPLKSSQVAGDER